MDNSSFLQDDFDEDCHINFYNDCEIITEQEISKSTFDSFPYLPAQKTKLIRKNSGISSLQRDIKGSID